MTLIEPTYLRYVYDGLGKGLLNAENAAALPYGFIGLYEEAFQSNTPITNRQSTLRQLAIWALFKGGVSTYLVSEILNIDEKSIKSLIDNFSSWFNTTDSNKYILYHDRLRTFLLQKLSSNELQELNEQIINHLEEALESKKGDEAEIYALEHLSTHMAVESQMDSNYERLHDFANKESIWPRQVSVSKEYKWSQQAVQYSIKEGARRHHEMNTLTATVNSVKLIQEEQNSLQQILDLLNEGDYQTALNRVKSLETDKQFTIYLLMLHELIFGNAKNASFKLNAIKNLIKDISLNESLYGIEFYPGLAIYKYHIELVKLNINDEILWEKMGFHYKAMLHLLKFENINFEIYEKLVHRHIKRPYDLINIYLRMVEFLFQKGDKTNALNYLNKAQKIILNLKKEDGNDPYGDFNEEVIIRSIFEVIEHKFNWFHYMFEICHKNKLYKKEIFFIKKLELYCAELKKICEQNFEIIGEEIRLYNDKIALKRIKIINSYLDLSKYDNKYIDFALSLIYKYKDAELDTFLFKNKKEELIIKAISELYIIENKSKSIIKINKRFNYNHEFNKIKSKYTQAKIILKNCLSVKQNNNEQIANEISEVLKIIDNLEYGANVFYLLEETFQILINLKSYNLACQIINKLNEKLNKLKNKNSQFYLTRIENIAKAFHAMKNEREFLLYSEEFIDVLFSLEENIKFKYNTIKSFLHFLQLENYNLYKKFVILLKSKENKHHMKWNNLIINSNDFETAKLKKDFYNLEEWWSGHDFGGNIFVSLLAGLKSFDGYKKINKKLNLNEKIIVLDSSKFNYKEKEYVLNTFLEQENYDFFIKKYSNEIFKNSNYKIINKSKIGISGDNIPAYNYKLCKELIKSKNLDSIIKIIKTFNFPENPSPRKQIINYNWNDGYPRNNFMVISLIDYLKDNLNEKDIVLEKIYAIIKNFTSTDKNSILNNINNKLESYKYLSTKLKAYGLKEEALIAIELWIKESPKQIMQGVNKYRDYSGISIDIINAFIDLIPKNKVLNLIDIFIEEHKGFVKHLLSASEILIKIEESKIAIELAKSLPDLINDDPFIEKWDNSENLEYINDFLKSAGVFDYDYLDIPKAHYLIKKNKEKEILEFFKKEFNNPKNEKGLYMFLEKIIMHLIELKKRDDAIIFLNFYKTKNKPNLEFLINSYWELNLENEFLSHFKSKLQNIIFDFISYKKSNKSNLLIPELLSDKKTYTEIHEILSEDKYFSKNKIKKNNFFNKDIFKSMFISLLINYSKIDLTKKDYLKIEIFTNKLYDRNTIEDFFDDKYNSNKDYQYIIKNMSDIKALETFLVHKTKMACFFENDNNEAKLDLIDSVIDIKEWRGISASIFNE